MDYKRIYNELITNALNRDRPDCYLERHHIIPRSRGGTDYNNIVLLTAREHLLAHILLAKIGDINQWASVQCFFNTPNNPERKKLRQKKWIRRSINFYRQEQSRKSRREWSLITANYKNLVS